MSDSGNRVGTPDRSTIPAGLQAALGPNYTVERELGRGGMATVYLARDMRHRRPVAVKVLRAELAAALGAERFLREIELTAGLQHPHILPLHDSGAVQEVLYYVMPYVEGETLRDRLKRDGELPVSLAVEILRDVAAALGYAHRHGVVHRDIKPENILLTADGDALVADFGVAKALGAAVTDGGGLTATGLTLGTPAYMAPEQAAADPHVDHRADLYALGVVGYEMLTGAHPYVGRPAHAVLAAHAVEVPAAVRTRRPSVPVALDHLVMRLLEKRPADRPQRGEDVVHALDAVTTPPGGAEVVAGGADAPTGEARGPSAAPRRVRRGTVIGVAAAVVLALLAAGGLLARSLGIGPAWLQPAGVLGERERLLLADFRGPPGDTGLGAVMTEALRADLGQSRAITLVSRDAVGAALQRKTLDPATRIDLPLARELATREGIKAVLDGEIQAVGTSYVLLARIISADSGETLAALRETAANAEAIIPAIDRLSKALRAKAGESLRSIRAAAPLANVTTPSLPALRKYVQGYRAWHFDGDYSKGVALMEEAIARDSNFASAYSQLGTLLFNMQVEPGRSLAMKQKAFDLRDRLPEAERLGVIADYYVSTYGMTRSKADHEKAVLANEAVLDLRPDSWNALNNLGILYSNPKLGDYATSEKHYAKALALDSTQSVVFGNLIRSQVNQGAWERARATIQIMGRRFPTHPRYYVARYRYAVAVGQLDSAEMIAREMWQARRSGPTVRGEGAAKLAGVAMTRGKIAEAQRWLRESANAYAEVGASDQVLSLRLRMAMNDAWFLGRRIRALEVADAVRAHALDSVPPADRPYELLASLYAMLGQQKRARAVLEQMDRDRAALPRSTREFLRQPAEGEIALAEKRYDDAIRLFEESYYLDCVVCGLPEVARAHDMTGNADSAIAVYERYLSTPSAGRGFIDFWVVDPLYLARTLKRLGELYEMRGADSSAVSAYTRFVRLWKDADAVLQPEVDTVRTHLSALTRRTSAGH